MGDHRLYFNNLGDNLSLIPSETYGNVPRCVNS